MVTATETSSGSSAASIAGMIAGLSGALAGATELILDAVTVAQVRQHLITAQEQLQKAQGTMPAIAASTVGKSWWGSQLSHHSRLAHTSLLDSITEMNASLDTYEAAMLTASKQVGASDEVSWEDNTRGQGKVDDGPGTSGSGKA